MNDAVEYRWHLRRLMAERGMFNTTALRPLLAERGVNLSASQVYRLVTEKPERLSLATLAALVGILGCTMDELIEVVPAKPAARKAAAGERRSTAKPGRNSDIGANRPIRARVADPDC
ncbi:XRE family transcriptional regulator [Mycolicibacterium grossiae]|uniref:XRE family transcriptional regulator n=1 Tax=Mycolicibacterium grossiae TaxID=1552759 RepID=A0A1E8Q6Z0_9MYCO|nr:helix-turn-helix transcriptional regulator [Mycolicibacterium grossiae]OFJ54236.1 XRE family transcriptional regulator [Mycolicibacterium grossiae]